MGRRGELREGWARDTRNDGGIHQRLSAHSQLIPERDAILPQIRQLIEMRARACTHTHIHTRTHTHTTERELRHADICTFSQIMKIKALTAGTKMSLGLTVSGVTT